MLDKIILASKSKVRKKILDKNNVNILYNSKWFDKFDLKKLIGLSSMENVARILERDDFKNRYRRFGSIEKDINNEST